MNDRRRTKPPGRRRSRNILFAACLAISAGFSPGCGKKGPPLAPLVKLPIAPTDLAAARRGNTVDLSFTVPAVNTDGTRPANVASAEVYAITAAAAPPLSDANLLKFGTRVAVVTVKAPKDPNLTADVDDPSDEVDPPQGPGLDQGAVARVKEPLMRDLLTPVHVPPDKTALPAPPAPTETRTDGPLLGPPAAIPVRTYAAFGTSTRGRKGPLSQRVIVPLVPPPSSPSGATIAYDEAAITLTWPPLGGAVAAAATLLPSRPLGTPGRPAVSYNVYDTSNPDVPIKLTATPIDAATFSDKRIVWGEKRCYTIVAAEKFEGATIESDASPVACQTLVDTFPPAAPHDLKAISSEGAINLIWDPNAEKDLAGYIVLRGVEPAETLRPIIETPIVEPSFRDTVQPGIAYVYAVRAVDKAGNVSGLSPRVVETAR